MFMARNALKDRKMLYHKIDQLTRFECKQIIANLVKSLDVSSMEETVANI